MKQSEKELQTRQAIKVAEPAPQPPSWRIQLKRSVKGLSYEEGAQALRPTTGGSPLPPPVQAKMERSFGSNFDDVRVRQGPEAQALGASAFARGSDITFAPGQYDPTSQSGQQLLGHELAHVVQQRGGVVSQPQGKGGHIDADPALEAEADSAGVRATRGEQVSISGARSGVQLKGSPAAVQLKSRTTAVAAGQGFRRTDPEPGIGLVTKAYHKELKGGRRKGKSPASAAERVGRGSQPFGERPKNLDEEIGEVEDKGLRLGWSDEKMEREIEKVQARDKVPIEEPVGMASGEPAATKRGKKKAVCIGNDHYDPSKTMGNTAQSCTKLDDCISDAKTIRADLRAQKYAASLRTDLTAAEIDAAIAKALKGVTAGGSAVVFFSGHGTLEGLVGVDGSIFSPSQALAHRETAKKASADFTFVTDACHAGIFVDAFRAAALMEAKASSNPDLAAVAEAAFTVQGLKYLFLKMMQLWWKGRYEVEAKGKAVPEEYRNIAVAHWNNFVMLAQPAMERLRQRAAKAGLKVRQVELQMISQYTGSDDIRNIASQLDDLDAVLNGVLEAVE